MRCPRRPLRTAATSPTTTGNGSTGCRAHGCRRQAWWRSAPTRATKDSDRGTCRRCTQGVVAVQRGDPVQRRRARAGDPQCLWPKDARRARTGSRRCPLCLTPECGRVAEVRSGKYSAGGRGLARSESGRETAPAGAGAVSITSASYRIRSSLPFRTARKFGNRKPRRRRCPQYRRGCLSSRPCWK
jgi:hypothetical protein